MSDPNLRVCPTRSLGRSDDGPQVGDELAADGETVLTMVSDDNFSMLQRTLLLQFTLAPD